MSTLKGGRGKKAPWDNVMIRCPEPISNEVKQTIDAWKQAQVEPESTTDKQPVTALDIRPVVERILRQKKSARVSVLALLAELGYDVTGL